VESGAQSASPLLFPETVFNAPASHLAAILGITGATYTLVGDGAVGLLAVRMAEDLMANTDLDHCVVVGAEEVDWILGDAYRNWRLIRPQPPIEPFAKEARGTILSEGAGAIVLSRKGAITIEKTHAGGHYIKRADAGPLAKQILSDLAPETPRFVIASANGTFIDGVESGAILETMPQAIVYTAKPALGESVGASGLWQIIVGAKFMTTGNLPPLLHSRPSVPVRVPTTSAKRIDAQNVLVLSCGLNQQISGLRLGRGEPTL
jgi:3-oxoacyl-(acyl-carrier-protein) synthase